jgi:hypothetical protein
MSNRMIYLILLCLAALPLAAQNAAVVGTVRDSQQAVISGATVTLSNLDSGVVQTTKTDGSGNYEFPFVKPGAYSLKAEQKGFETFVQSQFILAVDDRSRVDPVLRVGEATTLITVEGAAGGVQTESANLGEVITSKKISEIPLNGRFFLDLALMSAGTVARAPTTARSWPCRAGSASPASTPPARARTPPTT